MRALTPILFALAAAGCLRPADGRAQLDEEVGRASAGDVEFEVEDGFATVRRAAPGELELWAQAPALHITADAGPAPASPWILEVQNCMPEAIAAARTAAGDAVPVSEIPREREAACRFEIDLPPSTETEIDIAPPDASEEEVFVFAAMGDIQTALPSVDELFARINQDPEIRFVISMGDLVESANRGEYDLLISQLEVLDVPYFSTIGNHELDGKPRLWHENFGRYNIHFVFKGAAFSFVDSGSATLDPIIYDRLDEWLAEAEDRVHVFGTHYPPLDPIGVRSSSFRSRNEAAKLLTRLAAGEVDLTLYGHLHSYYAFENAGIPAYISGGGGALPERLDGIGRHYLRIEVDPVAGRIAQVGLVRLE